MKKNTIIILGFLLFITSAAFSQNDVQGARKYISNAKTYFKNDRMASIKSQLERAIRYDKRNPEGYFLLAVYYYNIEQDYNDGENVYSKFIRIMERLKSNDGGTYRSEYKRLKKYIDIIPKKEDEISEDEYSKIWTDVVVKDPLEECMASLNLANSQINNDNLNDAEKTFEKIKTRCKNANQEYRNTAEFIKAKIQFKKRNLEDAVKAIGQINKVLKDFENDWRRFKSQLKNEVEADCKNILKESDKLIASGKWIAGRDAIHRMIPFLSGITSETKAHYHYNYALIYHNIGENKNSRSEAGKAESLGYDENKITALLIALSTDIKTTLQRPENEKPKKAYSSKKAAADVQFPDFVKDISRQINNKQYNEAIKRLKNYNAVQNESAKNKKTYYSLLCKAYIKNNDFKNAYNTLKELKKYDKVKTQYRKLFDEWTDCYISHWENKKYENPKETINEFETLVKRKDLNMRFKGRIFYNLAVLYKRKNKKKFEEYWEKAGRNGYDGYQLAMLKQNEREDENVEYDFSDHGLAGKEFSLVFKTADMQSIKLYQHNKTHFQGKDVQTGPVIYKSSNEEIKLKGGGRYTIELENFQSKSSIKWYNGIAATGIILLFFFIR